MKGWIKLLSIEEKSLLAQLKVKSKKEAIDKIKKLLPDDEYSKSLAYHLLIKLNDIDNISFPIEDPLESSN